jgi:DNA-binding CsgD family transcriptional regulator
LGTGLLALVLASAPEMEAGFGEQGLRAVYDLTPAEARLAAALCAGQSLADHAESAGVSLNTVKYHLKSVFGKTGETRQPDLVRRLMADPVLRVAG